jgi:uncharacterized membrane protein YfcA
MAPLPLWLIISVLLVAALYSSVGHGGASGYLACLSLVPGSLAPTQMATTALTLNLLVTGIALWAFVRTGHLSMRLLWPFVLASVPAALLGGLTPLPLRAYTLLLAAALLLAAVRLLTRPLQGAAALRPTQWPVALVSGAVIGWLSGALGIGGGIFLSPLVLFLGWATPKQAAACSACFIFANSAAGLAGRWFQGAVEFGVWWPLVIAAALGALIGSRMGAGRFSSAALNRVLAIVLLTAAVKLLRVGIAS